MALVGDADAAAYASLDVVVELLIGNELNVDLGRLEHAHPAGFGQRQVVQQVYTVNPLEAAPEALDDVGQGKDVSRQIEVVHPEPVAYAGLIASGLPAGPLVLVHILLA